MCLDTADCCCSQDLRKNHWVSIIGFKRVLRKILTALYIDRALKVLGLVNENPTRRHLLKVDITQMTGMKDNVEQTSWQHFTACLYSLVRVALPPFIVVVQWRNHSTLGV